MSGLGLDWDPTLLSCSHHPLCWWGVQMQHWRMEMTVKIPPAFGSLLESTANKFILMSLNEGQGSLTFPVINPSSYCSETALFVRFGWNAPSGYLSLPYLLRSFFLMYSISFHMHFNMYWKGILFHLLLPLLSHFYCFISSLDFSKPLIRVHEVYFESFSNLIKSYILKLLDGYILSQKF